MQHPVADKGVFVSVGRLLELAISAIVSARSVFDKLFVQPGIPEATDFSLSGPDIVLEASRPILIQDRAVRVFGDPLQAEPHLNTAESEPKEEPNERNDPDPLLFRVFLIEPRSLLFALLDSPGLEVSWRSGGSVQRRTGREHRVRYSVWS